MIENPKLTLKILRHFARDDVPYSSNLTDNDLYQIFPDEDPSAIRYSIICAINTGLLNGKVIDASTYQGQQFVIGRIAGLTPQGGDYVRNAKGNFEKAVELISSKGQELTTTTLIAVLSKIVLDALS